MNSISAQSTTTPTLEDDIAHTRAWLAQDNSPVDDDYGPSDPEFSEMNSYPPMSSQEAETRRVEETLHQWEITEKQRRRATRESTSSTATTSSSLLGDVTRRASLLWKGGNRTRNLPTGAKHTALSSTDNLDTVPLGDIPASPTPTPSPSPTLSPPILFSRRQQPTPDTDATAVANKQVDSTSSDHDDITENPFDTPENSIALDAASPFADVHQVKQASTIESSAEQNHRYRLPLSFNHPEQRRPPSFPVTSPPQPINSPHVSRRKGKSNDWDDGEKPVRWWHEWLCGCGEGSDRGGDNQAGRTNPLE